jgi:hypothetical protein
VTASVIVLGLFDGALVELVDDPLDALGYLRALAAPGEHFAGNKLVEAPVTLVSSSRCESELPTRKRLQFALVCAPCAPALLGPAQLAAAIRDEIASRRVVKEMNVIYVDYTYTASYRIPGTKSEEWRHRVEDNRLEIVPFQDSYRIIAGM